MRDLDEVQDRVVRLLCRHFLFAVIGAAGIVIHPPAIGQTHVWQRWEHSLTSAKDYPNPFADVRLEVIYSGPNGQTLRAPGFWDGGKTFRIRCAFPTPGLWNWRTACSDTENAGLHQRAGTVRVRAYSGRNPLYRRGFLKVSANRRHLAYHDGTPFLWMGDTAWGGPLRASLSDWKEYLDDRVRKGFTVIQVGLAPDWAGDRDANGNKPFLGDGLRQWNPAFWQAYEQKIQAANEKGLVVLVVGLMEPTTRYPRAEEAALFARQLVGRLYGNFVIFSPSFDSGYMEPGNVVGRAVREATAVHLITQHPGTPSGQPGNTIAESYFDQPYLDFSGNQSGHNNGDRERCARQAIVWNLRLYQRQPVKPVVNLEAMYDGQGENGWTADDARSLAYRSWLSGAMGYTYGAGEMETKRSGGSGGLYFWVTDESRFDHWRKAMRWESSTQMKYLRDLLSAIPWWRLEPAHEWIVEQPEPWTGRRVLARTPEGDTAVIYVPDSAPVTVNLSRMKAPLRVRWLNPRTGQTIESERLAQISRPVTLTPPGRGDWALLITAIPARR